MTLRELARKKLSRGKIDCSIQLAFNNTDASVNADLDLAKRYIDIAQQIASEIDQPAQISPLDIMRWPGILKDQDVASDSLHKAAVETFSGAIDDLLRGWSAGSVRPLCRFSIGLPPWRASLRPRLLAGAAEKLF